MEALKTAIRKIILENFEPSTTFVTKIENPVHLYDFQMSPLGIQYGLETKDELEYECHFVVDWQLNISSRDSGIDSFDVIMTNVRGTILVKPSPDTDEEVEVPFNSKELHFKLINEMEITNGHAIYPTDLEVNFRRKEIQIN